MDQINRWLDETKSRTALLSEAYRSPWAASGGRTWRSWFIPAVFSTAAAIFAAVPKERVEQCFGAWLTAPCFNTGGLAAVLIAVHKALKCDEYQPSASGLVNSSAA